MGSSRLLPHKGYGGLSMHWLLLRHLARHGLLDKNPMNRARFGALRLFSVVNCVDQCAFRERAEWARVSEAALCSVDELRCFLSGGSRWVRALPGQKGGLSNVSPSPNHAGFGEVRIFCLFCNADQSAFRESSRGAGDCAAALCSVDELRCFLSGGSRWVRALPGQKGGLSNVSPTPRTSPALRRGYPRGCSGTC